MIFLAGFITGVIVTFLLSLALAIWGSLKTAHEESIENDI